MLNRRDRGAGGVRFRTSGLAAGLRVSGLRAGLIAVVEEGVAPEAQERGLLQVSKISLECVCKYRS